MYVFNAIEQDSIGLFKEYMRDWPKTMKYNVLFENYEELKEREQRTLLHFAIDCNACKILQYCLESNYHLVNTCFDGNGVNLITYSVMKNNTRALRLLLNFECANIEIKCAYLYNLDAMSYAAHEKKEKCLKLLQNFAKNQTKSFPTIGRSKYFQMHQKYRRGSNNSNNSNNSQSRYSHHSHTNTNDSCSQTLTYTTNGSSGMSHLFGNMSLTGTGGVSTAMHSRNTTFSSNSSNLNNGVFNHASNNGLFLQNGHNNIHGGHSGYSDDEVEYDGFDGNYLGSIDLGKIKQMQADLNKSRLASNPSILSDISELSLPAIGSAVESRSRSHSRSHSRLPSESQLSQMSSDMSQLSKPSDLQPPSISMIGQNTSTHRTYPSQSSSKNESNSKASKTGKRDDKNKKRNNNNNINENDNKSHSSGKFNRDGRIIIPSDDGDTSRDAFQHNSAFVTPTASSLGSQTSMGAGAGQRVKNKNKATKTRGTNSEAGRIDGRARKETEKEKEKETRKGGERKRTTSETINRMHKAPWASNDGVRNSNERKKRGRKHKDRKEKRDKYSSVRRRLTMTGIDFSENKNVKENANESDDDDHDSGEYDVDDSDNLSEHSYGDNNGDNLSCEPDLTPMSSLSLGSGVYFPHGRSQTCTVIDQRYQNGDNENDENVDPNGK